MFGSSVMATGDLNFREMMVHLKEENVWKGNQLEAGLVGRLVGWLVGFQMRESR